MVRVKQLVAEKKTLRMKVAMKRKSLSDMTINDFFHLFHNEAEICLPLKSVRQLVEEIQREMFPASQVHFGEYVMESLAESCNLYIFGQLGENNLLKVKEGFRFGEHGAVVVGRQEEEENDQATISLTT